MNILISNVGRIFWIRPISVHIFDGLVHSNRIQRVIISQHQLFNFLIEKLFIDFIIRSKTIVLIYIDKR